MSEREKISKALRDLAVGSRRNKTARLRECFDEVEAAKAAGASNKTIVAALEANGLFFDVNNFKNARSRILKERAIASLTRNDPLQLDSVNLQNSNFSDLKSVHKLDFSKSSSDSQQALKKTPTPTDIRKAMGKKSNFNFHNEEE